MKRLTRTGRLLVSTAVAGAMAVVAAPHSATAGTKSYTNACRNSVTTNWDQINATMTANSPAGPVAPGSSVTLSGIHLDISVPGAIFVSGYNLGLLTVGQNTIPATVNAVIDGTHTVQGSQSTGVPNTTNNASLTTTITDPDGALGTGDETATDATSSVAFPDQTWTAGSSGTITFAEHNDTAITGATGGGLIAVAHLSGGGFNLNVQFHCTSGTVTNGGQPAPPAVVTFANAPTLSSTAIKDTTAPTVKATAPTTPFALASSATLRWTASDSGSGLAGFQARYRKAGPGGGFGAWVTPTGWGTLAATARSAVLSGLTLGYDYCFGVRGKDKAGNWSPWTADRCVARPLDDRALVVAGGWSRLTGTAYWNSTVTSSKNLNATASRASTQLDRVGIVATRGPGMGTVGVYVGTTLIGKVVLSATTTQNRSLIVLPKFTLRTGTVTVKILTSNKTVLLDGLAVSRT